MPEYYCRGEVRGEQYHCSSYWFEQCLLRAAGKTEQCEYCAWYQAGHSSPHFPVPAIQVKCFFHPDYINVVQYNGREGIYGPGFMTIHEWIKDDCNWDDHPATCKCETCRYWGA